jgi:hypothetical protein
MTVAVPSFLVICVCVQGFGSLGRSIIQKESLAAVAEGHIAPPFATETTGGTILVHDRISIL